MEPLNLKVHVDKVLETDNYIELIYPKYENSIEWIKKQWSYGNFFSQKMLRCFSPVEWQPFTLLRKPIKAACYIDLHTAYLSGGGNDAVEAFLDSLLESGNYTFVMESVGKISSPCFKDLDQHYCVIHNQLYIYCSYHNGDISRVIPWAASACLANGFLLSKTELPSEPLSGHEADEFLGKLCGRVKMVVVCAYDQEGYLLAERIPSLLMKS